MFSHVITLHFWTFSRGEKRLERWAFQLLPGSVEKLFVLCKVVVQQAAIVPRGVLNYN